MYLNELKDREVQVKFKNLPEGLTGQVTGIYYPDDWLIAKMVNSDSYGVWLENPHYRRKVTHNPDGSQLPADEQKENKTTAHMMIRWEYIASIITCPNEATLGTEDAKTIGFKAE
ncbi:hypothetical protein [Bacillus marinisedimentorum]|uniref:hypothetical protein n=1 Tax=Bacillus marinisedimentorum TaxID=1821260 RepID=UPI000872F186|nr:hypothetical protein [Bacillus marinisedimentorum]